MTNTKDASGYGVFGFTRLQSGPFEGPAIVIPPALPEDTYFGNGLIFISKFGGKCWQGH